jgi:hypothetical protein
LIVMISSFVELTGGFCLITGFLIYPVLFILAANILLVSFAMSLREPLWDMKFVWPRTLLIFLLLAVPYRWHFFSVDYLLNIYGG